MTEEGAFSIITTYLRLAAQGETILAFRADEYYWRDLGKPDNVAQAAQDLNRSRCIVAGIVKRGRHVRLVPTGTLKDNDYPQETAHHCRHIVTHR